jgi:pimeloyl-ACP methyl ester carboxylesterase
MAPPAQLETINGCKIRYWRAGRGEPVLFLHDGGGVTEWAPFMEQLAQNFDVIVPEHPGFGHSEHPEWLDSMADMAYYYLDLLAQLRLSNVHLAGASLGGWLAAEVAVRSCHDLRSLTLVAPAGLQVKGVPKGDVFLWSPEKLTRSLYHDPAFAEVRLSQALSDDDQRIVLGNRMTAAKLAWQPRLCNPDLHKWLHRISVPTLLVWGENDIVIPPVYGKAFAEFIPQAKLVTLPRAGHLPHIEQHSSFVGAFQDFVAGLAAA